MRVIEGTGVNRKDTEKDTEKDTGKDTEQPKSSSASELVPILAPRWASKDGCRFRCILCAVGWVKADRRGPKGHPGSMYMSYSTYVFTCQYYCTIVDTNTPSAEPIATYDYGH